MTQNVGNRWLIASGLLFGLYCLNVALGKMASGSGEPPFIADVAISGDRIAAVVSVNTRSGHRARYTGRYFADCREHTPKPYARDPQLAERLWKVSEALSGVVYP